MTETDVRFTPRPAPKHKSASKSQANRGHPLAGRCQTSKRFHGGASRRFSIFPSVCSKPITPVSSNHGCDESRQTPIRIKRAAMTCLSPWRLRRPRRTLVPQRVQGVLHRPVVAGFSAPIPCWLTLRAIRFHCKPVTAPGVQFRPVGLNSSPQFGLTGAVETHAKQRVTSNGLRSFRM